MWKRDHKLLQGGKQLMEVVGTELFGDYNVFANAVDKAAKQLDMKVSAAERKLIARAMSWRDETAPPVVKKVHEKKHDADPQHGVFEATTNGSAGVVEYEPDTELRDSEQVPLLEEGGIEAFFQREVLPHVPDAWIDHAKTQVGYEISFTRHFYKPTPLRSLEEIKADLKALQAEAEGLLDEIVVPAGGKA